MPRIRFEVGSTFKYDDQIHQVVGFAGNVGAYRSENGSCWMAPVGTVVTGASFGLISTAGAPPPQSARLAEPTSDPSILHVAELTAHLLEAISGFRSGSAADARPDEPRAEYDPRLFPHSERLAHKAQELGVSLSSILAKKWLLADFGFLSLTGASTSRIVKMGKLRPRSRGHSRGTQMSP